MATCNVQTLVTAACQAGFNYLTPEDKMAVANQLLCNIAAGGVSSAVGVDGDSFVFKNGGGYERDSQTGLYYLAYVYTANGSIPAAPTVGSIGYTFATIPATPVYS